MSRLRVCAAAALFAGLAVPVSAEGARFPVPGVATAGTTRVITEEDAGAVLGGVQVFVSAGLDREPANAPGVASLLAETILRTPVMLDGRMRPLREAAAATGTLVSYAVDGRATHFYLEGRGAALGRALDLLGTALAAPDYSPAAVAPAAALLAGEIADVEGNPLSVGLEMFKHVYYQGAAGRPVNGTTETLAALTAADLRRFHDAAYRRGGVSFAYAGRPAPGLADALGKLAGILPVGMPPPADHRTTPIPATLTHVIAQRAVGAPFVVVGFAAPSPTSPDYGATLVLQSLIERTFNPDRTTTVGLAQRKVGALYLSDVSPASMVVYVNGIQTDPTAGLDEVLLLTRALGARALPEAELAKMRTIAAGRFGAQAISLGDRSYLLGSLAAQGLGADGLNASLAAIARTTPADVRRVARTYFERYVVSVILPRTMPPPAE